MSGQHGTSGYEDSGEIQTACRHQQTGNILVTVGHHHQCIKLMSDGHTLGGVSNQVSGNQGILHSHMSHGDTVADSDCGEHNGNTAGLCHAQLYRIHDLIDIHMTGNDLIVGADDSHHRLSHLFCGKSKSIEQTSCRCLLHTGSRIITCHH